MHVLYQITPYISFGLKEEKRKDKIDEKTLNKMAQFQYNLSSSTPSYACEKNKQHYKSGVNGDWSEFFQTKRVTNPEQLTIPFNMKDIKKVVFHNQEVTKHRDQTAFQ